MDFCCGHQRCLRIEHLACLVQQSDRDALVGAELTVIVNCWRIKIVRYWWTEIPGDRQCQKSQISTSGINFLPRAAAIVHYNLVLGIDIVNELHTTLRTARRNYTANRSQLPRFRAVTNIPADVGNPSVFAS